MIERKEGLLVCFYLYGFSFGFKENHNLKSNRKSCGKEREREEIRRKKTSAAFNGKLWIIFTTKGKLQIAFFRKLLAQK